jgi:enediyne biosynthesis protein E4
MSARPIHVVALVACVVAGCGREESAPATRVGATPPPARGFVETARAAGLVFKTSFLPGEQGEKFKINLYDHGTGLAVGDVDGDGFDDVYFLNQTGTNGLFRNDGHGRFIDVTPASGTGLGDRVCVAAVFGDVDGDGDQDLYVTSTRGGNVLFRNDGGLHFVDVTKDAGLTLVAHSESAALFDFDDDGDLDLFVTNTGKWTTEVRDRAGRYFEGVSGLFAIAAGEPERSVLYRNDGSGRFTDVTDSAGVAGPGWGGDMAVLDYDADGRQDLLVGNMFGASVLYRNEGGGRFADVTRQALGRTSWGAVGMRAFDYDGDGRLDLMIADMHSDMWMDANPSMPQIEERRKYAVIEGPMVERGLKPASVHDELVSLLRVDESRVVFGNTLFRNLGNGRFEETSDEAGVETFWPWGIAAADFDQDGDVDLFLPSGMGYPLFPWPNRCLANRGDGTFEERSREVGLTPRRGGEYLEEMVGDALAPRSSRAAAVLDYDGDGRPDLVVANFNDRADLYHNEFAPRSWVGFRLQGVASSRDAIGALVVVKSGGRTLVRQIDTAGGYLAQSTKTALFGLGDATKIDSCEIRWPSGIVERVADARLNAVNVRVEPREAR